MGALCAQLTIWHVCRRPFGYRSAEHYLHEMLSIIMAAELPLDRVVLDGIGYAKDVQSVAATWPGWLAYHLYPNWLLDGMRTQERV